MSRAELKFDRVQRLFTGAGFEPTDAEGRAVLLVQSVDAFSRSTGQAPHWGWFVPGRIEIFGKHTDYAGGRSLTCTVPRGFVLVAAPREDGRVRVIDARLREEAIVDLDRDSSEVSGWAKYVDVVARRVARDFPGASLGVDIALASDLPRAAGLSSSSALVVGLAITLMRRGDLHLRPEWRGALNTLEDLAGYLGAVENGLTFKTFTGAPGVGTDGGSEDHTAILMGLAGHVSAYSYLPVRRHGDAELPHGWRFVVAASGIEADKAGSARDQYNRASRATRTLLEQLNARVGRVHPHLAAAVEAADAEALVDFVDGLEYGGYLGARFVHFVGEDEWVPEALEAFRRADRKQLARLSQLSQEFAETLLENQIPETVELARLARANGAFAASSFGAGFGGSVWALVEADDAAGFATRWLAVYADKFPAIIGASSFVCRPAPPAMELLIDG
ncbi:MAG TPA: galactokinase family protein [Vicinamibacterales bacterium]|nr:galactokinase family protein [Vicinamibacterales bacterium]